MYGHTTIILIILYLTMSFGYSAVEKLIHWESSLDHYREHFQKTFLKNHVRASVIMVVLMEILSVGLTIAGLSQLLISGNSIIAIWGMLTMSLTLILLMTGQRIAQDYSGAMTVTVYFLLAVFGLFILENP